MSKYDQFDQYPTRGLAIAEMILLSVWPTLDRHRDDIVLVGGLAVHYLTCGKDKAWLGAVTMDVDLGLSMVVDDDRYGTIMDDMRGIGFRPDAVIGNRLVREVDGLKMYLDFMTDAGNKLSGTTRVGDVITSSVPGLNRALEAKRLIKIEGTDFYGVKQSVEIPVCEIGPLLVLKLNAFGGPAGRRHPKDAYDILLCVTGYIDGAAKAIQAFRDERKQDNAAFPYAVKTLENDFSQANANGPARAASFLQLDAELSKRLREELVTAAHFMLG